MHRDTRTNTPNIPETKTVPDVPVIPKIPIIPLPIPKPNLPIFDELIPKVKKKYNRKTTGFSNNSFKNTFFGFADRADISYGKNSKQAVLEKGSKLSLIKTQAGSKNFKPTKKLKFKPGKKISFKPTKSKGISSFVKGMTKSKRLKF